MKKIIKPKLEEAPKLKVTVIQVEKPQLTSLELDLGRADLNMIVGKLNEVIKFINSI